MNILTGRGCIIAIFGPIAIIVFGLWLISCLYGACT